MHITGCNLRNFSHPKNSLLHCISFVEFLVTNFLIPMTFTIILLIVIVALFKLSERESIRVQFK